MELLAALMDAPPGAVVSIAEAPAADPPAAAVFEVPGPAAAAGAVDHAAAAVGDGGSAGGAGQGLDAAAAVEHAALAAPAAEAMQEDAGAAAARLAAAAVAAAVADADMADAHQQEPAATFSDQTLMHKPAVAASPTVQCTGETLLWALSGLGTTGEIKSTACRSIQPFISTCRVETDHTMPWAKKGWTRGVCPASAQHTPSTLCVL